MDLYNRRLLLLNEDEPSSSDASSRPRLTAGPLSSSLLVTPLKLSAPAPFNSNVVYVVVILLFFIGFIFLFIRRFAEDPRSSARHSSPASLNYYSPSASCGGLDQTIVQSLPVFRYNAEVKPLADCAICLSEFENGEAVKMVPNCKHVFHQECVDKWLYSHVTCPICRGTRFFTVERHAESGKVEPSCHQGVRSHQGESTVENGETWREGRVRGTRNQRRSRSCSSFRYPVVLRRTLSY